jgi:hypothetical protein
MPSKSWWKRRQRLCCGTMRQSEVRSRGLSIFGTP